MQGTLDEEGRKEPSEDSPEDISRGEDDGDEEVSWGSVARCKEHRRGTKEERQIGFLEEG